MDELHTYMIKRHSMRVGSPLTFSDGERIVAVLSSEPVPGQEPVVAVTVLVELPPAAPRGGAAAAGEAEGEGLG